MKGVTHFLNRWLPPSSLCFGGHTQVGRSRRWGIRRCGPLAFESRCCGPGSHGCWCEERPRIERRPGKECSGSRRTRSWDRQGPYLVRKPHFEYTDPNDECFMKQVSLPVILLTLCLVRRPAIPATWAPRLYPNRCSFSQGYSISALFKKQDARECFLCAFSDLWWLFKQL